MAGAVVAALALAAALAAAAFAATLLPWPPYCQSYIKDARCYAFNVVGFMGAALTHLFMNKCKQVKKLRTVKMQTYTSVGKEDV